MDNIKYLQYDLETGKIITFYDKDVHGDNIPSGCIEITDEAWQVILNTGVNKYTMDLNIAPENRVYDVVDEILILDQTERIVIVTEQIDQEKLAMAEAVADLYEQMLVLQGGV